MFEDSNVLLVNVSVVLRPINVSVDVGRVNVPPFNMVEMIGFVNVLLVNKAVLSFNTMIPDALGTVNTRL